MIKNKAKLLTTSNFKGYNDHVEYSSSIANLLMHYIEASLIAKEKSWRMETGPLHQRFIEPSMQEEAWLGTKKRSFWLYPCLHQGESSENDMSN